MVLEILNGTLTFPEVVILVTVPCVIITLLYVGLFGKQVPEGTCQCCGQKLPEEKKQNERI